MFPFVCQNHGVILSRSPASDKPAAIIATTFAVRFHFRAQGANTTSSSEIGAHCIRFSLYAVAT